MPQPPSKGETRRHGLDIRRTADALAEAVDDPALQALLRTRPFVAVVLLAHQRDHVEITATGVNVTYGYPGDKGSIHITPEVLAKLQDTHHPDLDTPPCTG